MESASKIFVDNLSFNERLTQGVQVTLMGFLTVFAVLIILMVVVKIMEYFLYTKKTSAKEDIIQNPIETIPELNTYNEPTDEELIAVFAAAIAASLNTSTYNLEIKSYKVAKSTSPAWNVAARNNLMIK